VSLSSDVLVEQALERFKKLFGINPGGAACAPGRVEVLGNHTDYNGGYVMSAAIDRRTVVVGARRPGDGIELRILGGDGRAESSLAGIARDERNTWANYLLGPIEQIMKLPQAPALGGMALGIYGDVPLGSGLSSSASLEVATALAVQSLYPFEIGKMELAQLCQRAENEFVGVKCGLLDQFSSVFGRPDHLLYLDCLTLHEEVLAIGGSDASLVVCNSMIKHELTGGEYNERREECESAARKLGQTRLRDVSVSMLEAGRSKLTEKEYKRARHIVHEDDRVLEARAAVGAGDLRAVGRLMSESHLSSRDYFENSTPELDSLSEIARSLPGCHGARLTGGGFGGCVLSLVDTGQAEPFAKLLAQTYGARIGRIPEVFVCRIGDGARQLDIG
jgi:galactokinase